jgi:hypothetical protein
LSNELLTYCFDIDGTLCTNTEGDYLNAEPFADRINHVNTLFECGHTIKLFTARGSTTGIDWYENTVRQLTEWGVSFHELILGKPFADIFVDDRAIHSDTYLWK